MIFHLVKARRTRPRASATPPSNRKLAPTIFGITFSLKSADQASLPPCVTLILSRRKGPLIPGMSSSDASAE